MERGGMRHYYGVAESDGAGGFWISFLGRDGITSAATGADLIVPRAREALASVLMHEGGALPLAIEDGAKPPVGLGKYEHPLVVVIPFQPEAK
jgi:hypothetical protein